MAEFTFVSELGRSHQLLRSVRRMLLEEQSAGTIPANRSEPTGGEHIVYAGLGVDPLGFATFFEVGNGRVWLDLLIVRQGFRRLGLGRRLVEEVRRRAAERECFHVELGTMADNVAMQRMAGALGLAPIGLLYAVPTVQNIPPDLATLRGAERTISRMTAEQQSQGAALRMRIRRLQKQASEAHG